MAKEPKKIGRPSAYTPKLAEAICARLATGETLTSICSAENMPAVRTISDWKTAHEAFSANFARARDEGFDAIAADCLAIADDKSGDVRIIGSEDGEREVCNTEFVQRAKLRIETRLKLLAKWDPKRYGERQEVDLNHGVQDGLAELMQRIDGKSRGLISKPDQE